MKTGAWVGTSGWDYKSWARTFYPKDCPKADWFDFYVTQFPTVEVNTTFYRLPTENMIQRWQQTATQPFHFSIKGSRFITHLRRLKAIDEALDKLFDRLSPLEDRGCTILWQLPPNFPKHIARLEEFLRKIPEGYRHAVEFRHPSWLEEDVFKTLRRHNAALAWASSPQLPSLFDITADFVYLRFHGLSGPAHNYTSEELSPYARKLTEAVAAGKPCYVYFNNDVDTRAPKNAITLMKLLGDAAIQPATEAVEMPGRLVESARPDLSEPRSKRLRH